MTRIIEDGIDTYVVMRDDAALGWISRSHWHGKWRALSVSGKLSFHYTQSAAVKQILSYGKGQ